MWLRSLVGPARIGGALAALLAIGAGAPAARAQGVLDGLSKFDWKEFFTFHGPNDKRESKTPGSHLFCPEVIILDGTAAYQAHAGAPPTNSNLRYQYAISDTARDCTLQGDQVAIRVGIAGNVLLGPAGTPASFSIPLRVAVLNMRDNEPIESKLYHVAASVPQGESSADFTLVTEPLMVPYRNDHVEDDYTIKVGIDEGPQKAADKR